MRMWILCSVVQTEKQSQMLGQKKDDICCKRPPTRSTYLSAIDVTFIYGHAHHWNCECASKIWPSYEKGWLIEHWCKVDEIEQSNRTEQQAFRTVFNEYSIWVQCETTNYEHEIEKRAYHVLFAVCWHVDLKNCYVSLTRKRARLRKNRMRNAIKKMVSIRISMWVYKHCSGFFFSSNFPG